jgi:hypothetical protein
MLETGGDPDLALKPAGAERGNQIRVQDLEGDVPVVAEVARQEDDRHAASAKLALDRIPISEGLRQRCGADDHGESPHVRGCAPHDDRDSHPAIIAAKSIS